MIVELQHIGSASNDKFTAMLVNAIINDNHADAKFAQEVIRTRGGMLEVPQYLDSVKDIANSLVNKVHDASADKNAASR